ncbi:hypothetical protein [Burkholderia cepacia]|uniref:hypothetical protein n=1 Tax=Burkholderia cepacia TaxID=292 RepID=UPI00264D586E|nr:hypothetical protein [Burkholderia cepacia]MDN7613237.1 hypothetical protein [Burkholderia cepacia]
MNAINEIRKLDCVAGVHHRDRSGLVASRSRFCPGNARQSRSIRRNQFARIGNIGLAGQSMTNMRGDLVEDEKYIGRHEMDVALFTHSMRSQKMS